MTLPTPAMREAMAAAPLGDDVYGEDPTVTELQELLASMTGFAAGLYMPSGTMTNQVALAVHAGRGHEVILGEGTHVYDYEPAAMAVIGGLLPRLLPARGGIMDLADIARAIKVYVHQAPTGLIVLENTHNAAGGTVLPLEHCREVQELAAGHGLPVHLDGARAFNAATALGVGIDAVCAGFDSVSICLSKGLGAPVGSVLLGSEAFIAEARRYRKLLGGGMRQAGILAAAGIVAVRENSLRLHEDHARARILAHGLTALEGVTVDLDSVQSNLVYATVVAAPTVAARLGEHGVLCNALAHDRLRFVLHYGIDDRMVERALDAMAAVVAAPVTA